VVRPWHSTCRLPALIKLSRLRPARKELSRGGAKVFAYTCDVTRGARVAQLARRAVKDMGRVDILVNNAGVFVPGSYNVAGVGATPGQTVITAPLGCAFRSLDAIFLVWFT
jgi:NAD(P)-dependent dehydrogenase (short-subunit alcohol dehydrogenase family)